MSYFYRTSYQNFNPLSLYRERRYQEALYINIAPISIHSPYTGRDNILLNIIQIPWAFQSTLPIQGETASFFCFLLHKKYFNPLSLYRERRNSLTISIQELHISIHSPYTGRDSHWGGLSYPIRDFNPLSLYRERRTCKTRVLFLLHFNPLSLYRERPISPDAHVRITVFQSTLPIQGETTKKSSKALENMVFQSTLPIQGETDNRKSSIRLEIFQSTLPIQGETRQKGKVATLALDFNPLSLYRERHLYRGWLERNQIFQSTLPIQGETISLRRGMTGAVFQSTLPIQGETEERAKN